MNTRALLFLGSLGILLLSAASFPGFSLEEDDPHALPSDADTLSEDPHFKRLSAVYGASRVPSAQPSLPPKVGDATLWLARAIYSETKLPHEQELVAWVVRNRVETGFRGQSTYRDVVLDPYQFSAFNPGSSRRQFYTSLTTNTDLPTWQQALWIAYYVQHADSSYRPFSVETRHFYSEQSMQGRRSPGWARRGQFVTIGWDYRVDERRFRFYEEVS